MAMLHEPADPAAPMQAGDGRDVPTAQEGLPAGTGQRLHHQATCGEVVRIAGHAGDGRAAPAQELLARPVQVIEVAALAMGDEGMRHAAQQGIGPLG